MKPVRNDRRRRCLFLTRSSISQGSAHPRAIRTGIFSNSRRIRRSRRFVIGQAVVCIERRRGDIRRCGIRSTSATTTTNPWRVTRSRRQPPPGRRRCKECGVSAMGDKTTRKDDRRQQLALMHWRIHLGAKSCHRFSNTKSFSQSADAAEVGRLHQPDGKLNGDDDNDLELASRVVLELFLWLTCGCLFFPTLPGFPVWGETCHVTNVCRVCTVARLGRENSTA